MELTALTGTPAAPLSTTKGFTIACLVCGEDIRGTDERALSIAMGTHVCLPSSSTLVLVAGEMTAGCGVCGRTFTGPDDTEVYEALRGHACQPGRRSDAG